ncbi:uncharacterized protein LOC100177821 [Ciona intestinalis]
MSQSNSAELSTNLSNSTPPYDGSEMDLDAEELFNELGDVLLNDSNVSDKSMENESPVKSEENVETAINPVENEDAEIEQPDIKPMRRCIVKLPVMKNSMLANAIVPKKSARNAAKKSNRKKTLSAKAKENQKVKDEIPCDEDFYPQEIPEIKSYPNNAIVKEINSLVTQLQNKDLQKFGDKSRNAVLAKLNREKKKHKIALLETEVHHLRGKNNRLEKMNQEFSTSILDLQHEVKYLRGVIANQTQLSSILSAVSTVPGINLNSALHEKVSNKRCPSNDSGITEEPAAKRKALFPIDGEILTEENAGVCLHVSNNTVTIEMCGKCNEKHSHAISPSNPDSAV